MHSHNWARQNSCGFALVDLIVGAAFVGIVLVLALPAIQSARETARKTLCQDRLAEIGFDVMAYHDVYVRLPMELGRPGAVNTFSTTGQQYASPLVLAASVTTEFVIDPIFFDFTADLLDHEYSNFWQLPGWENLASTQPVKYRCPSLMVPNDRATQGTFLTLQPVINGDPGNDAVSITYDSDSSFPYGITNYLGCLGAGTGGAQRKPSLNWQYRGMITSRELVTFDGVTKNGDGLSNTVMFGESAGGIFLGGSRRQRTDFNLDRRVFSFSQSWVNSGVGVGRGMAPFGEPSTQTLPLLGHALKSSVRGFGSFHPTGVNFLNGDGSVHELARSIDMDAYYGLCGAFDGHN